MPEVDNRIKMDEHGVCQLCHKHKSLQIPKAVQSKYNLDALLKKVDTYKTATAGGYDCAVAISGGKDSIMVLYLAKELLHLRPLGVFIDNGFMTSELYQNAINAADSLGVDLVMFKTDLFKQVFKYILLTKQPFYYCRLCHALIAKLVHDVANLHGITLILGGFTKGQDFLKLPELFWIFKITDDFVTNELSQESTFQEITEMFPNLAKYFSDRYSHIHEISPFWYVEWNEKEIIQTISDKAGFKVPTLSWPDRSSNCLFNFVSQHLAVRHFGYSQHEPELSTLVRKNEMSRERALDIVNTPITQSHLDMVLDRMDLTYKDIIE
ncbi:phosphoadenosine phosphosulfate reductase [candidate division KSB3 bacterium]|uniref:Phosphoadenosine phosphosulfate reductase n=1 Tax=candidate division KSB3 bacterium TaxID=2044937 RepID=A0A2G6EAP9_9BACT|nr:MAG: phosphoadenosine phosphosulfate reductase [candidate division KSB3 bacterium]